jgi:two-component sensor histidine kinase
MGLTLVSALADQIDGHFSMEGTAGGTRCIVDFTLPSENSE